MKRICVYCGSSAGIGRDYLDSAVRLGRLLAKEDIELVYGGAGAGLMGAVASAALENSGRVIGVIPESFAEKVPQKGLSEIYVVSSMHERKTKMFDLSDGFIALPGGIGTLEELFEILTWSQLGFHTKPCGLLNVSGYFDRLLAFLDHSTCQAFLMQGHRDMILVDTKEEGLLRQFNGYKAPMDKWNHLN